ncbi:protein PilJ [Thiohalobacter sp. COW1]|uniref:methyl-accepting chemotaxis protein n=1 Tax=Thiohalobacter sp. COW1 TaxID=2795687 RepID=UPI00191593BE|nr:methyl-accepting chemotaxis protein [Thiohalobacter sp. COW1]BCO32692.1 protein PilJ [Thiohalobacter sp. COW1]
MSTQTSTDRQGQGKMVRNLILLLLASVLAMAAIFVYTARQAAFDKERIGYTSEQQVLSQQIAKYALEAASGGEEAFDQVVMNRDRFDQTLKVLRNGNVNSGLPPTAEESVAHEELVAVERKWNEFRGTVNTVLEGEELVLAVKETAAVINEFMPQLLAHYEDVVRVLVDRNAGQEAVRVASRQLMLSQRIVNNLNKVLAGEDAEAATEQFAQDTEEFGMVLEDQIRGGENAPQIQDPEAQAKLREIAMLFSSVSDYVGEMLDNADALMGVQAAASAASDQSDQLFAASANLQSAYSLAPTQRPIKVHHAYMFGGLALIFLIWLGWSLKRDADRRSQAAEETNKKNQEAILRLLDEMGNLADGDLSSYATVTEDFTGAIADSINFTIDALREVVTTINSASGQVTSAAEQTKTTAMNLSEASEHQAQEITSAVTAINEMAVSIDEVSRNAKESSEVSQKSVEIANKGGKAVRRTIEGMDQIREHIQETSKRIKRLGESSQEIGDIVELINDIAEQTNILALNAAIQAAMAGEAGRGFAVVADEVQRLAERSSNATKQIEALVKTIQTDTNEAVISMEQSTSGVVTGAHLAEDAGDALEEIVSVSENLAGLIENISNSAAQQSKAASNITETMNVIQEITTQTNTGTNETAASIGNLTELASDLQRSVSGFKLPE